MRALHGLLCLGLGLSLSADPTSAQPAPRSILVESPVLTSGDAMPRVYTPDGQNLSPPLTWSNLPDGTREIAVLCSDFGAGNPPPWVHCGAADSGRNRHAAGAERRHPGTQRVATTVLPGTGPAGGHSAHLPLHGVCTRPAARSRVRARSRRVAAGHGGPHPRTRRPGSGVYPVLKTPRFHTSRN